MGRGRTRRAAEAWQAADAAFSAGGNGGTEGQGKLSEGGERLRELKSEAWREEASKEQR